MSIQVGKVTYSKSFDVRVIVKGTVVIVYNKSDSFNPRTSLGLVTLTLLHETVNPDGTIKGIYTFSGLTISLFLTQLLMVKGELVPSIADVIFKTGGISRLFGKYIPFLHEGKVWEYRITFAVLPHDSAKLVDWTQSAAPDQREAVYAEQIDAPCYAWLTWLGGLLEDEERYCALVSELLHSPDPSALVDAAASLVQSWPVYISKFNFDYTLKTRLS